MRRLPAIAIKPQVSRVGCAHRERSGGVMR